MKKEFNFSTFADWMVDVVTQEVRYYKGDVLIDSYKIIELRNKHLFNPQRAESQKFSIFWGIRETGTWLYHVGGDNLFTLNELRGGLGAKHVYLITFQYDQTRNETITVREVDPTKL